MELQLRNIRRARGLSQEEVASLLGIKVSRYGTWERGERMLSLAQACELATIFDCSLDDLAGRKTECVSFVDDAQKCLNECYKSMNTRGRETLLNTAMLMSDSPNVRIEKDREHLPVSEEVA